MRAAVLASVVPKCRSASVHCSGDSTWRSRWCGALTASEEVPSAGAPVASCTCPAAVGGGWAAARGAPVALHELILGSQGGAGGPGPAQQWRTPCKDCAHESGRHAAPGRAERTLGPPSALQGPRRQHASVQALFVRRNGECIGWSVGWARQAAAPPTCRVIGQSTGRKPALERSEAACLAQTARPVSHSLRACPAGC